MGITTYDLPPGGLKDGEIATPSKDDVTFTWVYDQEELDKIKPTERDITNVKNATPNLSDEEVLIEAKQKRYRKTKTQEFRKQKGLSMGRHKTNDDLLREAFPGYVYNKETGRLSEGDFDE